MSCRECNPAKSQHELALPAQLHGCPSCPRKGEPGLHPSPFGDIWLDTERVEISPSDEQPPLESGSKCSAAAVVRITAEVMNK